MTDQQKTVRPFVSVIVPVFNESPRIDALLGCLTSQRYPRDRYEIIIVDNRSTDDTAERARRHSGVRVLQESTVQNADAARNTGIAQATGDIVAFTDGDCLPQSDWLAVGVETLEQQRADAAAGRIQFVFSATRSRAEIYDSIANLQHERSVADRGIGFTANLFVRRIWFDRVGRFPVGCGGDHELTRRISASGGRLVYAKDAVVLHRARGIGALLKKAVRIGCEKASAAEHRRKHESTASSGRIGTQRISRLPPHIKLLSPSCLGSRLQSRAERYSVFDFLGIYVSGILYVSAGLLSYATWRMRLLYSD